MSEQVEFKLVLNDPKARVKISGKVTASRRGSKYLESPTGHAGSAEAKWSLGENKATLERAGATAGRKLASALARADLSHPIIPGFPGLRFRGSVKALEGKFDLAKREADLDLVKITGAVDGDMIEILHYAGLAHLKDRVSCKASFEAEVGLSMADLTRLKAAWRAKEEVTAAAEAAAKHGEDFARHAEDLKKLDLEHKDLTKALDRERATVDKARRRLEHAKATKPTSKRAAAKLRQQVKRLEDQHAKARKALESVESKVAGNRAAVKQTAQAARTSRSGLAAAGEKLMKAGQKLDGALKGVTGKLGAVGKKALEKTTKAIMKKLGKTLLMKGLAKLVPGLNILSTAYDIGSLLWGLASGGLKLGIPGLGEEDSGAEADGRGTGGQTPAADPGDGTPADAGQSNGSDTAAPSKVKLGATAQVLADAYAGTSATLDDATAEAVNEGLPADISAAELTELVTRMKTNPAGGAVDPYELLAQIAAELADIRAGGTKVTIDDRELPAGPNTAEPPKSLLPGTRADVSSILTYDDATGEMQVDPARRDALLMHVFDHADGLRVKLASIDVVTRRPGGSLHNLTVAVGIAIEVVALPATAGPDYPYKVGQIAVERMTLLYNPERKLWGEMDYSTTHTLIKAVRRDGASWVLAEENRVVRFDHATVKVTRLAGSSSHSGPDGTVHRFALEVVPTEITAREAGYLNPDGWVAFRLGKPVVIGFRLTEETTPAATP